MAPLNPAFKRFQPIKRLSLDEIERIKVEEGKRKALKLVPTIISPKGFFEQLKLKLCKRR